MSLLARLGIFLVAAGALLAIGPGPRPVAAATVQVAAGDFWFCDSSHQGNTCTTTISVGDTVQWNFSSQFVAHTSTSNTVGLWDSGKVPSGGSFSHTFSTAGTFMYHCTNHPTLMLGTIVVNAPASVGGIARLPDAANGSPAASPSSRGGGMGLIAGSAAIAAGLFALGGAAWYARRRQGTGDGRS